MLNTRVAAFMDTTELAVDSSLRSAGWDSLRRAVAEGDLLLAVSEVTVRELARQTAERVEKYNEVHAEQATRLRKHIPELVAAEQASAAAFESDLRLRLRSSGVVILPLPDVGHQDLLERDISARRPFKRNGTGYRDALIWLTFVQWVDELRLIPDVTAYFISANRTDYADQSGQLHSDLSDDLTHAPVVRFVERLADIVSEVRPPANWLGGDVEPLAASNARSAAVAECLALRGFPFDDLEVIEPFPELPSVVDGVVRAVLVDEESIEVVLVDEVDGIQIWDVILSARMDVSGLISSGFDRIPSGWRVGHWADEPLRLTAEGSLHATFTVDVRINEDAKAIDSAISTVRLR